MYHEGSGGAKQSYAEAAKWYRKSAEQGIDAAQYMLGNMYYWGHEGVKQDKEESRKWLRKAARQGHVYAQQDLRNHFQESW